MNEIDWHRLPPLSTLRAFEATARLQGYSAAARALNVTPAAIAQQVRKLESEVGTSLVRREGRGLVLTAAGRQLASPLREAFALISIGIEDVRLKEASRSVRVSTTHFFVDAMILPKLGEFWIRHPGVQVTFSPDGNHQPVNLEDFDICVRGGYSGESWPGYDTRRLLESPIIVCAAPSLIETANGDLSALPWLYERSLGEGALRNFAQQAGFDPEAIQIVDPGSVKLEIEAALLGYGLSISTELVIRRQLADGTLVRVDTPLDVTATYSAIFRKGPMSEPVMLFLDWLTTICAEYSESRPIPASS